MRYRVYPTILTTAPNAKPPVCARLPERRLKTSCRVAEPTLILAPWPLFWVPPHPPKKACKGTSRCFLTLSTQCLLCPSPDKECRREGGRRSQKASIRTLCCEGLSLRKDRMWGLKDPGKMIKGPIILCPTSNLFPSPKSHQLRKSRFTFQPALALSPIYTQLRTVQNVIYAFCKDIKVVGEVSSCGRVKSSENSLPKNNWTALSKTSILGF